MRQRVTGAGRDFSQNLLWARGSALMEISNLFPPPAKNALAAQPAFGGPTVCSFLSGPFLGLPSPDVFEGLPHLRAFTAPRKHPLFPPKCFRRPLDSPASSH